MSAIFKQNLQHQAHIPLQLEYVPATQTKQAEAPAMKNLDMPDSRKKQLQLSHVLASLPWQ